MQLREGEKILKIYHHHPTPFFSHVLKVIFAFVPFFILLYLMSSILSSGLFFLIALILFFIFILIIIYVALIYWLDRLIVTNQRVLYIDYKYLTVREDAQAFLSDIQDIQTEEQGILAYFKFFDYGTLRLDTPSSYVTLTFVNAPDPEGIRQFIYQARKSYD